MYHRTVYYYEYKRGLQMLLWFFTAFASEASASIPITHPQTIDFSILDTLLGSVIAIAAMIVVGFFLLKYKIFIFGGGQEERGVFSTERTKEIFDDRELRRADRLEIREEISEVMSSVRDLINELREDMRSYLREQLECQRSLPEKYVQWEAFNRLMSELKQDRRERWEKFDTHTHDTTGGGPQFIRRTG
jgi:hypothetical protein